MCDQIVTYNTEQSGSSKQQILDISQELVRSKMTVLEFWFSFVSRE